MKNIFKFKPKIKTGHSFNEYLDNYSNDYVKCKLEEVTDKKKLKPNKTYWKINNKYYQINHKNIFKWIFVGLGSLGIATSVALPITYHFLNQERYVEYNFKYWNECDSLNSLKDYVKEVVNPNNKTYIPKEDRIATFDMDGTLYGERAPIYIEWLIFNDYFDHQTSIKETDEFEYVYVDKTDPEEKEITEKTTFKVLYDNIEYFKENRKIKEEYKNKLEMMEAYGGAVLFSGLEIHEYTNYVNDYLEKDVSAFTNLKFKDMFYLPMIEVVEFLQLNNFDVYVVSGTDRFMVREIIGKHFNIDVNRVIGMDVSLNYDIETGEIFRGDKLRYKNVEKVKVELIAQEICKRPVLSFGNSSGDVDMHSCCLYNPDYKAQAYMINNDDNEREYSNPRDWSSYDYHVFSMKNDFKTIYGDNVKKTNK